MVWDLPVSIKEGFKIIVITTIAIVVGVFIQFAIMDSEAIKALISQPSNLLDTLTNVFLGTPQELSIFVILIALFAFSTSFLGSIQRVLGGVELGAPKKEKKAEITPTPTQQPAEAPQPEVMVGENFCQICGKPISPGRAICKECEEKLKTGVPPGTPQE